MHSAFCPSLFLPPLSPIPFSSLSLLMPQPSPSTQAESLGVCKETLVHTFATRAGSVPINMKWGADLRLC